PQQVNKGQRLQRRHKLPPPRPAHLTHDSSWAVQSGSPRTQTLVGNGFGETETALGRSPLTFARFGHNKTTHSDTATGKRYVAAAITGDGGMLGICDPYPAIVRFVTGRAAAGPNPR